MSKDKKKGMNLPNKLTVTVYGGEDSGVDLVS